MGIAFNAEEIYRIGIEIERNGKAFYEAAARRADAPDVQSFFAELARWEDQHIQVFERLREAFDRPGAPESIPDLTPELVGYLAAAADNHVFGRGHDPAAIAAECTDTIAALEKAIQFEKDSVVVYASMLDLVPPHLGRKHVERLIQEELAHVTLLSHRRDQILQARG